jgi:hypothetical protein
MLLEKTLASSKLYEASRRLIGAESVMRHVDDVVRPVPGTRLLGFGYGNSRLRAFIPDVSDDGNRFPCEHCVTERTTRG